MYWRFRRKKKAEGGIVERKESVIGPEIIESKCKNCEHGFYYEYYCNMPVGSSLSADYRWVTKIFKSVRCNVLGEMIKVEGTVKECNKHKLKETE